MTTAADIVTMLEDRHRDDLFATEVCCRRGSLRLDAWAMQRTWKQPTTGYEIKVSRADWIRDSKIEEYQGHVHRLILVCPHGLIQPNEVPQGVGLQWVPQTGSRLVTKRRPAINHEAKWTECLHSLAINRVRGFVHRWEVGQDSRTVIRRWLEGKARDHELGHALGTEMARRVAKSERCESDLQYLKEWIARLSAKAKEAGFWSLEAAVDRAAKLSGEGLGSEEEAEA